jgi:hypothetical protein
LNVKGGVLGMNLRQSGNGTTAPRLRRLIPIVAAYLAATFVSSTSLLGMYAGYGWLVRLSGSWPVEPRQGGGIIVEIAAVFGFLVFGAIWVGVLALLPSLAVIIYAERTAQRSARFYAVIGALAGPTAYLIYILLMATSSGFQGTEALFAQLVTTGLFTLAFFGTAGIAGGLVYWGLAGRSAGSGSAVRGQNESASA